MTEHVRVHLEAGVLRLTIARPEKKNALTSAMYGALADALVRADSDRNIRVVLFESEGDVFTAGNDIDDFAAVSAGTRPHSELRGFDFISQLGRAQKPLVAAVQGTAVGVGLTMLLHCDLVFVAEDAKLSAPFVNLALIPEAASTILLRARIGHARAYAMFALGEPIDGKIAVAWRIANAALPRSEVRARALEPTLVVRLNTYTPPVRVFLTAQMRIRLAPILRRITRQQIAVFRSPSRFLKPEDHAMNGAVLIHPRECAFQTGRFHVR